MKKKLSPVRLAALLICLSLPGYGALIKATDLSSLTATRTFNSTGFIANSVFTDGSVDGDANVDENADITFAWEMTLLNTVPNASRRSLIEFGGGGTGLSVVWTAAGIFVETQQSPSQIGGDGSGDTAAVQYVPTGADIGIEKTWIVALDLDPISASLSLFVDEELIAMATGVPQTSWAGGDNGQFWGRSGTVLLETFGSGSGANAPISSRATVNTVTGLRLYEDTVASTVPEPSTLALAALALLGMFGLCRHRSRGAA